MAPHHICYRLGKSYTRAPSCFKPCAGPSFLVGLQSCIAGRTIRIRSLSRRPACQHLTLAVCVSAVSSWASKEQCLLQCNLYVYTGVPTCMCTGISNMYIEEFVELCFVRRTILLHRLRVKYVWHTPCLKQHGFPLQASHLVFCSCYMIRMINLCKEKNRWMLARREAKKFPELLNARCYTLILKLGLNLKRGPVFRPTRSVKKSGDTSLHIVVASACVLPPNNCRNQALNLSSRSPNYLLRYDPDKLKTLGPLPKVI